MPWPSGLQKRVGGNSGAAPAVAPPTAGAALDKADSVLGEGVLYLIRRRSTRWSSFGKACPSGTDAVDASATVARVAFVEGGLPGTKYVASALDAALED